MEYAYKQDVILSHFYFGWRSCIYYYACILLSKTDNNSNILYLFKMLKKHYKLTSSSLQLLAVVAVIQLVSNQVPACNILSCQACSPTSADNCASCQSGYGLAGATCCLDGIQNCASCLHDSGVCQNCTSDSYCLFNNTCRECGFFLSECATCANSTACLTCNSTLYAVNSNARCQLCSELMSFCSNCSNRTTCTICVNDSYAINSTSSRCQLCSSFFANCTNCVSELTCISCEGAPKIVFLGGRCEYCGSVMPKCLNCTKFDNCTLCSQYYAVNLPNTTAECAPCPILMAGCMDCSSSTNCTLCSLGHIVSNGCSSVAGCSSVIQTPPTAVCEACQFPQFESQPVNGVCLCRIGHLAGRFCTQIIGCTNIIRTGTSETCLSCNIMQNFQLRGAICECRQYFNLNRSLCVQACGDGKLFVLPCDDGNLVDGDGCSSTCKIEKGYTCRRDTTNHQKSDCAYDGTMSLALKSINNLGGNTASLLFSVAPFIPNFVKSNLTGLINFSATANCTMTDYSIEDSLLSVYISFETDVENTEAALTLKYDSNYIVSPDSTIKFQLAESDGDSLLYNPDYYDGNNKSLSVPLKVASILMLATFLFASYSHKMIGVETLHAVQLIFLMQVFSQHYIPVVVYFSELASVLNLYQKAFSSQAPISTKRRFSRLGYSADFISNMSVTAFLQLTPILIAIFLTFLQKCYFPFKKAKLSQKSIKNIQKMRAFVYKFLIFPIVIGTFLHFILSLMIHSNIKFQQQSSNTFIEGLIAVVLVFCTFLIFFNEWFQPSIRHQKREPILGMKEGYVPLYLTNTFIISMIAYLTLLRDDSQGAMYVFAAFEVLNAISLLAYRPYERAVHFVGLIINQTGVLLNVAWIVSQKYFSPSKNFEEIAAFAEIGWIGLIAAWSIVRAVSQLKGEKPKPLKEQKEHFQFDKDELVRAILRENESHMKEYCLNSQFLQRGYSKDHQSNSRTKEKYNQKLYKQIKNEKHKRILEAQATIDEQADEGDLH